MAMRGRDSIRPDRALVVRTAARRSAVLVAAGLLASSAGAASDPSPRPLSIGRQVTSEIDTADRQVDGHYSEDYVLELARGDNVRIDLDAVPMAEAGRQLDTFLRLLDAGGHELALNDDRGDGTLNSTLIFQATEAGRYTVRAQGFSNRTGAYRLLVSALPPPPPAQAIAPGRSTVELNETAGLGQAFGTPARYRDFEFEGAAGDRVYFRATPAAAGPAASPPSAQPDLDNAVQVIFELFLNDIVLSRKVGLTSLDDPQLLLVLPSRGRYRLRIGAPVTDSIRLALQFDHSPAGGRSPAVRPWPRNAPAVAQQLSLASEVQMTTEDPNRIAWLAETYAIPVRANERIVATLSSTDFDPVLDAGTPSILGFATALSDNDSGGGTTSRLELRPSREGIVHLRVRSTSPALGRFELRLERGTGAAPPAPPPAAAR